MACLHAFVIVKTGTLSIDSFEFFSLEVKSAQFLAEISNCKGVNHAKLHVKNKSGPSKHFKKFTLESRENKRPRQGVDRFVYTATVGCL